MHEKHGFNGKDRIYRIWVAMRQRCEKPYTSNFARYGAQGVRVCEEWNSSFPAFRAWALANGYADALSIDRIDPNGNYTPENCRWATAQQQATNQRTACLVEVDGVTLTVAEWAKLKGFHLTTLYRRYRKGIRGKDFLAPSVPKLPPMSVPKRKKAPPPEGSGAK